MRLIYIGTIIPEGLVRDYPETSIAANNFQTGLIYPLVQTNSLNCLLFSVPARRAWPAHHSLLSQSGKDLPWRDAATIHVIPFCNLKFWKEMSIRIHCYFKLFLALREGTKDEKTVVLSYNGDGRISAAIRALKKRFGFSYICMVVDPPEYKGTTSRKGKLWEYIYSRNRAMYLRAVQAADALVVLNEAFITINDIHKPYLLIDGGVSLEAIERIRQEPPKYQFDPSCFHVVFTGTLHEHSGVLRLIDMFESCEDAKLRLHIFGDGLLRDTVARSVELDSRIEFHGGVDFASAVSAQQQADLIVCPNPINHPINKVAFPSKLIEYLASGTPILATSLDSIGEEYRNCVVFYDDTEADFREKLASIMKMSSEERHMLGKRAFDLARNQKEWQKQSERLLKFIKEQI